jgi:hypothetical protein
VTMRLDLVTNDAGELVRREHARDLGSGVVVAIYRMAKLAQLHDLQNQAFLRQLDQGHAIIQDYCLRSGMNVNILFAHKAIFVAGQLMKGSRAIYDMASELGDILEWCGGAELTVTRDASRDHLFMFSEAIRQGMRNERGRGVQLPANTVRLRPVTEAARLRGLEVERLPDDQRTVRMYASAVVVMRRFFEDLQESRYVLPRRIKRIAQSLVDLSAGSNVSFLGVTEARNANHDEAGRAVNSAILAVAMARELEADRAQLSQIAMAAMMHDVGRPRAMSLGSGGANGRGGGSDMPMPTMMTLSEDQEDRLPGGTAAVLTALGRLNEPTIGRTVVAFEALWQRRQRWIGPLYRGARTPTLHARLVWVARRYNDLVTPEPGLEPPTPYSAIGTLFEELTDPADRTVLQLLVAALGIIPIGTVVQLSTGEMAEVIARRGDGPLDQPVVRLLAANGAPAAGRVEIDLARPRTGEPPRHIGRVMSIDFWGKGAAPKVDQAGYDSDPPPSHASGVQESGPAPAALPTFPSPTAAPGGFAPRPSVANPPRPGTRPAAPGAPLAPQIPAAPRLPGAGLGGRPLAPAVSGAPLGVRPPSQQASALFSEQKDDTGSVPSLGTSPSQVGSAMGRLLQPSAPSALPPRNDLHRNTIVDEDAHTMMVTSPLEERDRREGPSSRSQPLAPSFATLEPPTAKGVLETTPLPHVLVYMLDHQLSGTVVLYPPGQAENAIVFLNGVPAKVKLGLPGYFLGEYLTESGALRPDQLNDAVRAAKQDGTLMGEFLVRRGAVSRGVLQDALERQLVQRVAFLANLAPRTEYSYFADRNLLGEWGSDDLVKIGALNAVLAAVRIWKDRARVAATLSRLGNHQLVMHERVDLAALHLTPQESSVLDALITRQPTYAVLNSLQLGDPEVAASLVYSLAVTRQFAFPGQVKAPMAPRTSLAPSVNPAPAPPRRAPAPASSSQMSARPGAPAARVVKRNPASGPERAAPATAFPTERTAGTAATAGAARPGMITPVSPQARVPMAARPNTAASPRAPRVEPRTPEVPLAASAAPSSPPASSSAPSNSRDRFDRSERVVERIDRADHVEPMRTVIASTSGLPAALGGTAGPSSLPPPSASGSVRSPSARGGSAVAAADAEAAMGHFRTAETQLQRGDLNGALAAAERAVAADPSQSEYAALRAWTAALARGTPQVNASIAMLDEILSHEPKSERALLYRGKLYKRANQPDQALADLERLLALNPKHREANGEVRLLKMHVKKA